MKSEKSFLITVLKLKLWTVILHQKLSEWLGEYDCRRAKGESFGVMESFGIQLEGVVTLIYSCVKNHVPKNKKKAYFSACKLKKKKDNLKLQNILNFKVVRCLASDHNFVNGSQ